MFSLCFGKLVANLYEFVVSFLIYMFLCDLLASGWLLGLGVDLNLKLFKFTKNHTFSYKSHSTNSYEIATS